MIKEFIKAWDTNKTKLEEYIKTHKQHEYGSYEKLVKMLFKIVVNPYFEEVLGLEVWDYGHTHVIDDGSCQGAQLFIIPLDTYQPSIDDYVITHQYYGSCSGCDTLLAIQDYNMGIPTEEQVKHYMTLELHLLQRCKYLYGRNKSQEILEWDEDNQKIILQF